MYVSNPHSIQNTEVFDVNNKEAYNIKVVKFGGSSLASAEQFVKVANIVKAEDSRKYVVPFLRRHHGHGYVLRML